MARKKIVFVIMEGPSDDGALGVLFSRLYDRNVVHVAITYGDITSDVNVNSGNISAKIGNIVRKYAEDNHFKKSDFQEVIHLVDMDGAYISKEAIIYDEKAEKPYYTMTEIRTDKPDKIVDRNQRKSENIDRICFMGKVWGNVPYRSYYMSVNLDHVLYDKLNSTDEDKEQDAFLFARKYKDHLNEFLEFISESEFSVRGDYKQSWEYIKEEKHSLERHSNMGICFNEMKNE